MLLSCFFSPLQQDPDFSLPHLLFGNPVFFFVTAAVLLGASVPIFYFFLKNPAC
jgi:hypothetical protein